MKHIPDDAFPFPGGSDDDRDRPNQPRPLPVSFSNKPSRNSGISLQEAKRIQRQLYLEEQDRARRYFERQDQRMKDDSEGDSNDDDLNDEWTMPG